ncbi:hypothetical protein NPIL_502941 [Nephila pilipes]|uniref:Uncharacterized protein n=1 Tax=Nephila pilipes TaxID=299642 RepID=A0A8X6U6R8_NEPPI|nr:hypothetical protein NPIL_502941 [Nephila pilipes]
MNVLQLNNAFVAPNRRAISHMERKRHSGLPVKALDLRSSVGLRGDSRTSIGQVSRIQSSVIVTRGIMKEDTFAESVTCRIDNNILETPQPIVNLIDEDRWEKCSWRH